MKPIIALLGLLILLAGCATPSIQTASQFGPDEDFDRLKTFAWFSDEDHPSEDLRVNNEFVRSTVRQAAEQELEAKGYTKVARNQADFLVTWFGAIDRKVKVETMNHFYSTYGYGTLYRDPYWNRNPGVVSEREFEQGTIIFDFLDPRDNSILWRGAGRGELQENIDEQTQRKNLTIAVGDILAKFPPEK
jgi:hypothetical protein